MRKFLVVLFIFMVLPVYAPAKVSQSDSITAIESSVFGYDYKNESDAERISRIEQYLYGAKKAGDIQSRIKNIKNDIGYTEPPEVVNKPALNEPKDLKKSVNPDLMALKEDASVEYPIVDKMEQAVFNTTYKSENIYKRLDRLETKVFNKTTNESLNDRVDALSRVIVPVRKQPAANAYSYSEDELNTYYANSGLDAVNDNTVPFQLAVLEQELLRGNYQNDNISNRLSRLEEKMFKRTFATDSDISRLQRLMVAYDAKKNSYKYENNRKMQNMATVSQLGGILLMILAILL